MKNELNNIKGKVLIACKVDPVLTDGLTNYGFECITGENITRVKALAVVKDCTGIITSTKLIIDKELLDAAQSLQWIGRMGSGMEIVDVEYAAERNIKCWSSPEGNANAVGEHALGMLLALTKRIAWSRDEMLRGEWKREQNRGTELEGKTIAIIGFGNAGGAFAKKLAGFDVNIVAYDKYHPEKIREGIITCHNMELIFETADIVSFHVPLQKDTIHYFDDDFCNNMSKAFILLNTSRGPVVNFRTLYHGLLSGKISGACLDVFETEPPFETNDMDFFRKLISLPQVVVTPHIAGYSFEAIYKMSKVLLEHITGYL